MRHVKLLHSVLAVLLHLRASTLLYLAPVPWGLQGLVPYLLLHPWPVTYCALGNCQTTSGGSDQLLDALTD